MSRPPVRARLVPIHALAALLAGALALPNAQADPRWWWSDQRLTSSPGDSITPHVAAASLEGAIIQGGGVFITYAEVDPAEGDLEIWALASFDGGCSFCPPTRLTDNAVDDANPRIAALVDSVSNTFSVAVAWESESRVLLGWDVDRIGAFESPSVQCEAFAEMGPGLRAGGQLHVFGAPGSLADSPDVAAFNSLGDQQFHLVWHDTRDGEDDVFHARDLSGRGGAGWLAQPARNLTTGSPPGPGATHPRVGLAAFTDADPGMRTGLTVDLVFLDESDGSVHALRSTDSGTTFSPAGARADAPAGRVSEPGSVAGRPALSVTGLPWANDHWVATAWEDLRLGGPEPEIRLDARYFTDPVAPAPDWQDPDLDLALTADVRDGRPTIGIQTDFGGGDVPVWTAWQQEDPASLEIFARPARLQAVGGLDASAFPFPPVRGLDPATSVPHRLTHCAFDEASFDCLSDRVAGEASQPSMIADFEHVFLVFADSRDGASNIFFKRTDRWVWGSAPRLGSECSDATSARVQVEFDVQASCPTPFAGERMLRYRVYHGPAAGGPYDNAAAPVEIAHDLSLGTRVRLELDGFAPDEPVCVIVVPEDEARNLAPPDFDPGAAAGASPANETCFRTASACAPSLRPSCAGLGDRCPADPALDDDGQAQPGELVPVAIDVFNGGSAPATDYRATLVAAGASVIDPPGGLLSLPLIPPGESRRLSALLELPRLADGALCGDAVDLSLTAQSSNGGLSWPDSPLVGCDFTLGPDPGCTDCAASAALVASAFTLDADSCSAGAGNADGVLDPGEQALLGFTLVNAGGADALGVTGRLELLAGAAGSGPLAFGPLDLAAGASAQLDFPMEITAACGDAVLAAVRELATASGESFDDAASPSFLVGANPRLVDKLYRGSNFFTVPDGGTAESPDVLAAFEGPVVDLARLEIQGWFPNRPNLAAELEGPAGVLDVSAALDAPLDLTAEYATVLGGAGDYRLRVRELAPDAEAAQVWSWSLELRDTAADCRPCVVAPECLYRQDVTSLAPHVPARADAYRPLRSADGLGIDGAAIACPFASGDLEPDAAALDDGVALSVYQVNRPGAVLRLERVGRTIRFLY